MGELTSPTLPHCSSTTAKFEKFSGLPNSSCGWEASHEAPSLHRAYIGGLRSASHFYVTANILTLGWVGECAMSDSKQDLKTKADNDVLAPKSSEGFADRFGTMATLLVSGIAFLLRRHGL